MGPFRRLATPVFSLTLVFLLTTSIAAAAMQTTPGQAPAEDAAAAGRSTADRAAGLPRTMRFSGVVHGADNAARSGVVALTFTLYSEAQGGAPVWVETQNVTLDENGRYTAMLGATSAKGLPVALFASGEARWLGVRVAEEGAAEQSRVQLVSVPYALAAADAQSLGGHRATDFQLTRAAAIAFGDGGQALGAVTSAPANTSSNTVNRVARFTGLDTVGDSQIFDNGSNIGIGTTTPSALFHVNATAGDAFNLYTSTTVGGSVAVYANHFGAAPIGYAGFFTKTGAGTTNIGLYAEASGGTNNYAALFQGGNVGIGTSSPVAKLQVNATNQDAINIYSTATGGGSVALYAEHSGASPLGYAGYFNKTGAGTTNIGLVGSASGAANNYAALFPSGNVGIGTSAPTQPLEVAGTIYSTTGGFKFPDGSTQTTAATGGGAGDITSVVAGNGLAGGATSGDATLNIKTCTEGQILKYVGTTWTCSTDATTSGAGGGATTFSGSTASGLVVATQTNSVLIQVEPTYTSAQTNIPAALVGIASANDNLKTAAGVAGFANSIASPAVFGWNGSTSGIDDHGVGVLGRSDNPRGRGVEGEASSPTGDTAGVSGNSMSTAGTGVRGMAESSTGSTFGVLGQVNSPNGTAVYGLANGTGVGGQFESFGGIALRAIANGNDSLVVGANGVTTTNKMVVNSLQGGNALTVQAGGTNLVTVAPGGTLTAGSYAQSSGNQNEFNSTRITGTLQVTGSLSKGSGTFKIDHPLDPANKYLYHSFVESPDMMNIYNGVVMLDAMGQAWVTMPDWFEALNMDFRYQLTPIGNPGRRIIYVASEIKANRFRIAGGRPGSRISWQVTGIRHDAYANAHRIQVEENKPAEEKGTYLHPEAFKKPVLAQK